MQFRYDINVLRAIAVIGVVLFHFHVPFFDGGFAGVDIFFVISGYLMSKIIITGLYNDSFNVLDFYKKRATRIIPALLLLVLFVLIVGQIIFFGDMQKDMSKYALSSIFFVSNLVYYFNSNYFDLASQYNILLHTWSLSVEWQFYILYPIFLLPLKKIYAAKVSIFKLIIISLTVFSFLLNLYVNTKDLSLSFYSFPTRSWEMLMGCIVFLYEGFFTEKIPTYLKKITSIIGYTLLLGSFVFYDENMTWPNYTTILPVAATALILLCNYNFKILENPILNILGKISYSLYLWHWPFYVIALYFGFLKNDSTIVILLLLSIGASYLSFKYVETNREISSQKSVITSMIALSLLAIIPFFFSFNEKILDDKQKVIANYESIYTQEKSVQQFRTNTCFLTSKSDFGEYDKTVCLNLDNSKKNVLLIGDSHAAQYSQSLLSFFEKQNINLLQATSSSCTPFPNSKGRPDNVKLMNNIYLEYIPEYHNEIDFVILSCHWINLSKRYTNDEIIQKINETMALFEKYNIPYALLGQTKAYILPYPDVLLRSEIFSFVNPDNFLDDRTLPMNNFLKFSLQNKPYIDIHELKLEVLSKANNLYMHDKDHFTYYGTEQAVDYFDKELDLFTF
ncbi:acyltransferase family protein [Leeuwenhoekiella sp. LLG6367-2.1]|uniref:acyltransferase family protein n=1 Tax=Leeuwenhoekiella sp. LLG6367-2.1 TaxID=3160833 RepID=UPI00386F31D4